MLGFGAVAELVLGEFEFVLTDTQTQRIFVDITATLMKQSLDKYYLQKYVIANIGVCNLVALEPSIVKLSQSKATLSRSSSESV